MTESLKYSTALATCAKNNNVVICNPNTEIKYEDALSSCSADEKGTFSCVAKPVVSTSGISTCTTKDGIVTCVPKTGETLYDDGVVNCSVGSDSVVRCKGVDPLPSIAVNLDSLRLFNSIAYWLFTMTVFLCVIAALWFTRSKTADRFTSVRITQNAMYINIAFYVVLLVVLAITSIGAFLSAEKDQEKKDQKGTRAGLFAFAFALAVGLFIACWINLKDQASQVSARVFSYLAGSLSMAVVILCVVLFIFGSM